MLHPTRGSVRSLVLTQAPTSTTHGAGTGASVLCTFGMWPPRLLISTIQTLTFLCSRMSELQTETINANGIYYIRNDQGADKQLEHFVPDHTSGLTLKGLGRINQSIMAFGYCILGCQADGRSSILGATGTAVTAQADFLTLLDDAIKTLTVSTGPVKYQNAIEATKVRLNLAVAWGVLLLPARMIINTESVVGYNNNLLRATDDMKLGVNNYVNQGPC